MPKEVSKSTKPNVLLAGLREVQQREVAKRGTGRVKTFNLPELDPKELRTRLKFTQVEFCAHYCLPIATLKSWEQGRRVPDQTAQLLLYLISEMPVQVASRLAKLSK